MYFTDHEQQFAYDVAEKMKAYGFFITQDGKMFYDKDNIKELSMNHLVCMLRKDLEHNLPKKRFEKMLHACIKAVIIMAQRQIEIQLTQIEQESIPR